MGLSEKERAEVMLGGGADQLLHNAIDMHCHAYPEVSLRLKSRVDDVQTLEMGRNFGMRAIVLKSHLWPTTGLVYHLRQRITGIEVFGSITLNLCAGGFSPWVVEAAALQGAKVIWMPTWTAANAVVRGGFSRFMEIWLPSLKGHLEPGMTVFNSAGQLTTEVRTIIKLARELELVLSTGHLSSAEALAIAEEAEKVGFTRLIFGHPLSGSVGATLEDMKEMAKRGAYVEMAAHNAHHPASPKMNAVVECINELGAEHCILTTDTFGDWSPPAPEFLRMFISSLLLMGIREESIKIMVQRNPASLLGLAAVAAENESNPDGFAK